MKNLLQFILCFSITLFAGKTYSSRIVLNFFSSETGYRLQPENIQLQNTHNSTQSVNFTLNHENSYSASIPEGSYQLIAFKQGYSFVQTNLNINSGEAEYDIYMDPFTRNEKLNPSRITSLLKPDKAYLLGYIVDDFTGLPVINAELKDAAGNTIGRSNSEGFFETYVSALCETRTFADLNFSAAGYKTKQFSNFELTPNTDFIFTVRLKQGSGYDYNIQQAGETCSECRQVSIINDAAVTGFVIPLNIKVGRNCTGTNCTTVEIYTLQTYCKYVLPAEIYSCWGNLSGGMEILLAECQL
ncbi:MAG: hypothetical protein UZ05_CHB002002192, partial [Chlorobi bacterium OLB5]